METTKKDMVEMIKKKGENRFDQPYRWLGDKAKGIKEGGMVNTGVPNLLVEI